MHRRTRSLRGSVLVAVAGLVIAGCSGESSDAGTASISSAAEALPGEIEFCEYVDRYDDVDQDQSRLARMPQVPTPGSDATDDYGLYSLRLRLFQAVSEWETTRLGVELGIETSTGLQAREGDFVTAHNDVIAYCRRIGAL